MEAKIENGILWVGVPVEKRLHESASGKTLIVATSHGNAPTSVQIENHPVVVSFNAFITNDDYVEPKNHRKR